MPTVGWDGREAMSAGMDVYIWLIHVVVQQKLTDHHKAIILQLKRNSIFST